MHCEQAWCEGIREVVLKKRRYKSNSVALLLQNKNINKTGYKGLSREDF